VPGSSTWQSNFDIHSYGSQGAQNQIYRGRIRYEKNVLWIGPNISYDLTNESFDAPSQALPFDTYSGGTLEFLDDEGEFNEDIPVIEDLVDVINESTGFIPVVSALDIKKVNGNDPTPGDYLKTYAGGQPQDSNLESGFDAFIVDFEPNQPTNNEHISFQPRNGNWLADELEAESPADYPVVENCSWACDSGSSAIIGPGLICDAASFTFPHNSDNIEWSVEPSSAGSINVNPFDQNQITFNKSIFYLGSATLIADVSSVKCDDVTFSRDIWLGGPSTSVTTTISGPDDLDPGYTGIYNVSTGNFISVSSYDWFVISNDFPNAQQYFDTDQTSNGTFLVSPDFDVPGGHYTVQVRASNACGYYPISKTIYVEEGDGTPVITPVLFADSYLYKIYPNPSSSYFNVGLVDSDEQPVSSNGIYGELLDLNGLFVRNITINNNQAQVDASDLRKGVYILRIHYDNKIESHQVIIDR
jgi:hypothetical protein